MTVADVADEEADVVAPPGLAVMVYPVIAEPPLDAGAVHETDAWVFPAVAATPVGDPGDEFVELESPVA